MAEVQVGNIIRDNDPRQRGKRKAKVVEISDNLFAQRGEPHAHCHVLYSRGMKRGARKIVIIPLRKIHTDGKRRKSGWDLLPAQTD